MRIVSSAVMWWGGASNRRAPSSMPVGYASQTGYQYDSISRVAGQREPAPPSKFSKEGGFKNSVFKGINGLSPYLNILEMDKDGSQNQPDHRLSIVAF